MDDAESLATLLEQANATTSPENVDAVFKGDDKVLKAFNRLKAGLQEQYDNL